MRTNLLRCSPHPLYGSEMVSFFQFDNQSLAYNPAGSSSRQQTSLLESMVQNPVDIFKSLQHELMKFICRVPTVTAPGPRLHASHLSPSARIHNSSLENVVGTQIKSSNAFLHPLSSAMKVQFPESRLIQYDCGKLQTLDKLLWTLKSGQHRVLIFTQMSKMLDILEQFLNHHGHTYLRLDGATKIEQRQALMERFNADKRIFCFILSTRSGGIGVNLTGADTVIFYDSDWNPTMDAQAQDRCHRIGQTRDVHIYRLVSEMTVEENILKKAQQKRLLGDVAIEDGNFTTAFFKQGSIKDLFDMETSDGNGAPQQVTAEIQEQVSKPDQTDKGFEQALAAVEDDQDIQAGKNAKAEASAELAEFDENIPLDDLDDGEKKTPEEEQLDDILAKVIT